MEIVELELSGLKLIKPKVVFDERGFFLEKYSKLRYKTGGIDCDFVQDNYSFSQSDVLRGMHFQKNPGQNKLISVIEGTIFDVAVDIRPKSETFKKWYGVILDGRKHEQLFIPQGFAHGFCVLSEIAHVHYKVSSIFSPISEMRFRWDDPDVKISWPISEPILSHRDKNAPLLREVIGERVS